MLVISRGERISLHVALLEKLDALVKFTTSSETQRKEEAEGGVTINLVWSSNSTNSS